MTAASLFTLIHSSFLLSGDDCQTCVIPAVKSWTEFLQSSASLKVFLTQNLLIVGFKYVCNCCGPSGAPHFSCSLTASLQYFFMLQTRFEQDTHTPAPTHTQRGFVMAVFSQSDPPWTPAATSATTLQCRWQLKVNGLIKWSFPLWLKLHHRDDK